MTLALGQDPFYEVRQACELWTQPVDSRRFARSFRLLCQRPLLLGRRRSGGLFTSPAHGRRHIVQAFGEPRWFQKTKLRLQG